MATVHIIGAGLAGLACAVRLAGRGRQVALHEAAPQAGGRCRTFFDAGLDRTIDNGSHLLLSANQAVLAYQREIGAVGTLTELDQAAFPFFDLGTGEHWTVRLNDGPLPWWIFDRHRRIPATRPGDYLSGLRLLTAGAQATVADCIDAADPLYQRFWEPLTLAVMNAAPTLAAARPLRTVLLRTFARGGRWCRPLIAHEGLSAALVAPAVRTLERFGAAPRHGRRLRTIARNGERVTGLEFGDERIEVGADDPVVLALPPSAVADLLPEQPVPEDGHAIVNAHFRLDRPPTLPGGQPFLGMVGSEAHWLFVRGDVVSVTVSGAGALAEEPGVEIARRLWAELLRIPGLAAASAAGLPPVRVIKEKRATFVQTPLNQSCRPPARTRWRNLFLAGDWTDTGLPATLESAVTSGQRAAGLLAP
jgi:squalene-associated FAD-dependent desaturase